MAHDYEGIFDTEDMDDDELRRLVRETLRDNRSIDATEIAIRVQDGEVLLAGRVGTDEEKRIAERLIQDRLGLDNVRSQLVVDSLRRAESPEAADEHMADEEEHNPFPADDSLYGSDDDARRLNSDLEGGLDRTMDSSEATELGIPWVPPESPTPEGTDNL